MNYHHPSFFILHPSFASRRARLSHPSTRSTRRRLFTRRQHPHSNSNSHSNSLQTLILRASRSFFTPHPPFLIPPKLVIKGVDKRPEIMI